MILIKSLLVLCSAAAVMARGRADAVMSAALFFGEDTTESFDPVDIFRNPINHATAAASALVFSAEETGYWPNKKSAKSLALVHDDFVQKATTFPGFTLQFFREANLPLKNNTTVQEFEQAIREPYSGLPHIQKIAFKFASLVPLYQENESLKNWTLSLVVLDKPQGSNTVRVQFGRVDFSIAFDHTCTNTKAYIPQQQASAVLAEYVINVSYLSAYAEQMANMIPIVDVEHKIAFFASPESDADRPFAFGSQQRVLSF
ncbi:hypothetical protein BGZ93_001477 [Podila epicladia]|nr:hypothetical protein BGZ92_003172 [Podila epicladia]KAG0083997.1 hypothetical protein BGZ93_001477 [Podila epicladia]